MRVFAARELVGLQDNRGLTFLVEGLENGLLAGNDHYNVPNFRVVVCPNAIPLLIRLLYYSKKRSVPNNALDFLESKIMEGFFGVGTHSVRNFALVRDALSSFMHDYRAELGDLNYLSLTIQRIEEQLLEKEAGTMTLEEAVAEYDRLVSLQI